MKVVDGFVGRIQFYGFKLLVYKIYRIRYGVIIMKEMVIMEIMTKEHVVTNVTCDFCGEEFDKSGIEHGWYNTITVETTYGSKYDGFRFSGEICDACIEKIIEGKLQKTEI